ncbi:hypothetical protein AAG570_004684 [Ranatra chinensis]|uniref:Uncharacterized protein n=1 Tax=Ranatra chinensis TaxID=642074 RepID=A0ABD0YG72_9HEMI
MILRLLTSLQDWCLQFYRAINCVDVTFSDRRNVVPSRRRQKEYALQSSDISDSTTPERPRTVFTFPRSPVPRVCVCVLSFDLGMTPREGAERRERRLRRRRWSRRRRRVTARGRSVAQHQSQEERQQEADQERKQVPFRPMSEGLQDIQSQKGGESRLPISVVSCVLFRRLDAIFSSERLAGDQSATVEDGVQAPKREAGDDRNRRVVRTISPVFVSKFPHRRSLPPTVSQYRTALGGRDFPPSTLLTGAAIPVVSIILGLLRPPSAQRNVPAN